MSYGAHVRFKPHIDKGKPAGRRGRKASGLKALDTRGSR